MTVVVNNVINWFGQEIFSKKLGPLLIAYGRSHEGSLGELLILMLLIEQRPSGWEREVERFIVRANKNSFYLNRIYHSLHCEYDTSFCTEEAKQQLRHLAAMSLAKHIHGPKHPDQKLIERTASTQLD